MSILPMPNLIPLHALHPSTCTCLLSNCCSETWKPRPTRSHASSCAVRRGHPELPLAYPSGGLIACFCQQTTRLGKRRRRHFPTVHVSPSMWRSHACDRASSCGTARNVVLASQNVHRRPPNPYSAAGSA
ncbi:hypothetical protein CERZMDRAFT_84759 [Cercospora zeae-maydis SCOH1-5]|uniref:Uncharacterized protein n=1 Tax=Cercospora zeae-maydis SCOH1-5 TaxID=717836 RepID=A0A6A6FGP8_9PEZI|nr:hypothetical protein CERZMDRAFT_84759 [Cercospora zeae-maydis SCOH1-5]